MEQNAEKDVNIDAQIHNTENHACFFVTNAVQSVCVCLLVLMAISNLVLATTIGRPKGEVPSALNFYTYPKFSNYILSRSVPLRLSILFNRKFSDKKFLNGANSKRGNDIN